jgi:4-alpha-glucanotransferase
MKELFDRRRAGILLHPTSLPGSEETGDLGLNGCHFVDLLVDCGVTVWQVLPLGPTHDDGSPYQCLSVHAGNPRLISFERLVEAGWLEPNELAAQQHPTARQRRQTLLQRAYQGFREGASRQAHAALQSFCEEQGHWLEDYALYQAIKTEQAGQAWSEWPKQLRQRETATVNKTRQRLASEIKQTQFEQYVFFRQWEALKRYANARGVLLFGDMPIFVAYDSADVWAHREYFDLNKDDSARVVAGVPPDYFSATGQLWGNPHYRWDVMQDDGFLWWKERMETQLRLFDIVRIDHFRGFEAYWEVPAGEPTAINGRWVKAPGDELFAALTQHFERFPIVAEDLGVIGPEVEALRDRYGLPGMRVLHFGFEGGPENPHQFYNHKPNGVVYTGTHDNDTTLGWFQSLAPGQQRHIYEYLGSSPEPMPWLLIRLALLSVSRLAILPMQDLLELDSQHRMNRPGTAEGNWQWRFTWDQVAPDMPGRLGHLVNLYGRSSGGSG